MNTHVRDNLLQTAPAKVTTAGDLTYATAVNNLTRLGVGSTAQFLKGGTSAPVWSNQLEGTFIVGANNDHIRMTETDAADAADYWMMEKQADQFRVNHFDDSTSTTEIATRVDVGDWILHTGDKGTDRGAVIIATDTETGPTALTTAGNTILSVPSFNTGDAAYVEGFWMLEIERTSAASVSTLDILPRDDGVNLATWFRIDDPNGVSQGDMIPAATDQHVFGGMFWVRHTASNTSSYTIFVVAGDNSRFRVNDGHLYIRSIQYPT